MKKLIFVASFLSALMFTQVAGAQTAHRNAPRHYQVKKNIRHERLTEAEARHLKMKRQKIKTMKKIAMADGRMTLRERQMLYRQQQKNKMGYYKKARSHRSYR